MKKAVFAGSFDPFTLGHKDIVCRAASIFDEVIVAVATETGKCSRAVDIRKDIAVASLEGVKGVSVTAFDGLLTDFIKRENIKFLVRGARTGFDYEYEKSLMSVYRSQCDDIEFVILPSRPELNHISSTVVRELAKLGGDIKDYVDTKVEKSVIRLYRE